MQRENANRPILEKSKEFKIQFTCEDEGHRTEHMLFGNEEDEGMSKNKR